MECKLLRRVTIGDMHRNNFQWLRNISVTQVSLGCLILSCQPESSSAWIWNPVDYSFAAHSRENCRTNMCKLRQLSNFVFFFFFSPNRLTVSPVTLKKHCVVLRNPKFMTIKDIYKIKSSICMIRWTWTSCVTALRSIHTLFQSIHICIFLISSSNFHFHSSVKVLKGTNILSP